jgi:MFS family permease
MLFVGSLAVFLSGPAQTYGVSVFIDPMLADLGWSRSFISSAYSAATLLSAGAVLVVGRLNDRFGARIVMSAVSLVFVVALLTMGSVANPVTIVFGFTLLRAAGSGSLTLTARTMIAQWYVRRRGRAISLVGLGSTFSLAMIPPANAFLIEGIGWRSAWRINALIIALVLIPAAVFVVRSRPEEVGQYPDGEIPATDASGAGRFSDEVAWTLGQAFRVRTFWLLLGASIAPSLVVTGLNFNQISIFTSRGLPSTLAATILAVQSVVAFPVTLLAGWLSDRFQPRFVLVAAQAVLALATVWMALTYSVEMALIYGALQGLTSGLWNVAVETTWPAYFGRRYLGSIRGITFAATIAGAAAGPLPFGFIYDAFGRYDYVLWGIAILPILATIAVSQAYPPGPAPVPPGVKAGV